MLVIVFKKRPWSENMRLTALVLGAPLLTVGCHPRPALQRAPSNNAAFAVDYLFTHDGCRVYRFIDRIPHYFVKCTDGSGAAISPVSCGKNCVQDELISSKSSPRPVDGAATGDPPGSGPAAYSCARRPW